LYLFIQLAANNPLNAVPRLLWKYS